MKRRLSWWEYEYLLEGVDFTIIGAGIVGISTAIELKLHRPDAKILVLDKKNLPYGASTKNAGFACFGSISEIVDDIQNYGEDVCAKLIKMRFEGLRILKSRVSTEGMGYESKPGAEIFENVHDYEKYQSYVNDINEFISPFVGVTDCFQTQKSIYGDQIVNRLEGSLNPQKMMLSLENEARKLGVIFLHGIEINKIHLADNKLESALGDLYFKKLIVCTNGFSNDLLKDIDLIPARNQVLITSKIPGFSLSHCYHMHKGYVYFKEYKSRLIIGGGRHLDIEGETTSSIGNTSLILNYLKDIINRLILPESEYAIEHEWSGVLGVGSTKMPEVRKLNENCFVAIRMGGMGVAIGSFIGKVVSSQVLSIDNSASRLYVS